MLDMRWIYDITIVGWGYKLYTNLKRAPTLSGSVHFKGWKPDEKGGFF
jgi:hypothetical protein